ncbi:glutamine synthetase [Candidatus Marinamargulisbacteria bacterium SCGC AG-343-D04]|nr:glutamine synthetase [Candidatus Marinamargulisbacteria bacterium SCGC AG-343-D04]
MKRLAEYIWIDGTKPTSLLRSKTRVIEVGSDKASLGDFPEWGFDGSSTNQATGDNSDCILRPVSFVSNPIGGIGNFLVMCEVFDRDGNAHESNTRSILRQVLDAGAGQQDAYLGFEQEYTMFDGAGNPLGWPENGFPGPQGPYYCGVGAGRVEGRELVDKHLQACLDAGLLIYGINAEVMLGQWEFQVGYRGFDEPADPLTTTDHHWYATWILQRLSEDFGIEVSLENKPMKGDWNGAGCHTNFSTKDMRDSEKGKAAIDRALKNLEATHQDHIKVYGDALDERLTGDHETCDINTFRYGNSDRGASIRVPLSTAQKGYGYLEDRRPGANTDPYLVSARILATILDIDYPGSTTAKQVQTAFA